MNVLEEWLFNFYHRAKLAHRIAGAQRVRRYVLVDERARANDRAFADSYASNNDCLRADPNIAADSYIGY